MCVKAATLRLAESQDRDFLLALRNDPDVRRWFYNSAPISASRHQVWFHERMSSSDCRVYIQECGGKPIGYVRFELLTGGDWQVSIAISPEYQGNGYGRLALREALDRCFTELPCDRVVAEVLGANRAALALFQAVGFQGTGASERHGQAAVRLEYRR